MARQRYLKHSGEKTEGIYLGARVKLFLAFEVDGGRAVLPQHPRGGAGHALTRRAHQQLDELFACVEYMRLQYGRCRHVHVFVGV